MIYDEYWKYPDKKLDELHVYINGVFGGLQDETQSLAERFQTLDGELTVLQRKRLHRDIEKYEDADYYDNHMLRLYMMDLKRRTHIKSDDTFWILMMALFIKYYYDISSEAKHINDNISAHKYNQFTGKKQPETLPKDIYAKSLPSGVSPDDMINTEAVYRAERVNKMITANKLNDKEFDNINTPSIQNEFAKAKNSLLKPSGDGGHHGILDTVMTNMVGYTAIQAAEDIGAETYTFHAIIDDRTTPACRGLNSRTFKVSEMKLGYNVPPIAFYLNSGAPIPHPCRSWITLHK